MDNKANYFLVSGLLSISLFLLVLVLFIYMMFVEKENKIYALTKDKFIAVSIVLPKEPEAATHKKSLSKQSASIQSTTPQNIDVNDLFSDVWTQKITHKKKKRKVNSKRIQDIVKKINTAKNNSVESITDKIEKLDAREADKNQQQSSSGNEVNEYLAKIQAIVYQHFHVPSNSEGNSVKTVIELDSLGRMTDFRILNYSSNEALNEEVDKIKERLKNVVFPKNPQNRSSRTIVVLISKE